MRKLKKINKKKNHLTQCATKGESGKGKNLKKYLSLNEEEILGGTKTLRESPSRKLT